MNIEDVLEKIRNKRVADKAAYWAERGKKIKRVPAVVFKCETCLRTSGTFEWFDKQLKHIGCPGKPKIIPKTKPSEPGILLIDKSITENK